MGIPMDMFIPECEADGSYKKVQCYRGFQHWCWCVDENGNEIQGTKVEGIGSMPVCGKFFFAKFNFSSV